VLAVIVALVSSCTPTERRADDQRSTPKRAREAPSYPPVLADSEDCGSCGRDQHGACDIVRYGPCAHGPEGVSDECEYRVPCDERCCDRFPLLGGVALVRPEKPLYSGDWPDPRIEVARVPRDSAGLLVRVTELDEEQRLVHVKTLAVAPPAACKGALDDLRGVVLWAGVEPKHLQRPSKACAQAVYALDDPEDKNPGINKGDYEYPFDPSPFGDARVVKAWNWIDYPPASGDSAGAYAGAMVEHIVLPEQVGEFENYDFC
jgi:hypothetical protein